MAGAPITYYRNYDSSDMTKTPSGRYASNDPLPTIEACGWEPLSGYQFKEWNVNQDGSGLSFQPGDTISGGSPGFENDKYAIWEPIPVPYLVMESDLTAVADAIRDAGGTQAALEWPDEFVDAIADLGGGGTLYTLSVSDPHSTGDYAYDTHGNTITTAQLYAGQTFFVCKERLTYVVSSPSISPTLHLMRYVSGSRYEDATVYEMPASDTMITFDFT